MKFSKRIPYHFLIVKEGLVIRTNFLLCQEDTLEIFYADDSGGQIDHIF